MCYIPCSFFCLCSLQNLNPLFNNQLVHLIIHHCFTAFILDTRWKVPLPLYFHWTLVIIEVKIFFYAKNIVNKCSFINKIIYNECPHALLKLKRQTITKTRLYNFDPLKPHFYIVKLGFTWVYIIFLISAQKHRLWVFVRTASTRRF